MVETKDIYKNFDTDLLQGDFIFDLIKQDLTTETGIRTAVIISIFTDRRAAIDDVLPDPNSKDRRGWWADLTSDFENDQIGSKLWLLSREKTLQSVLVKTKEYIEESIEWMTIDNVIKKSEVIVERQGTPGNDILAFNVKIYQLDDSIYTIQIGDIAPGEI